MRIPYLTDRYNYNGPSQIRAALGFGDRKLGEQNGTLQKLSEKAIAAKQNIRKALENADELNPLIDMGYSKEEVDRSYQSEVDYRLRNYYGELNGIKTKMGAYQEEIHQHQSAIENAADPTEKAMYEEKLKESREKMDVFAKNAAERLNWSTKYLGMKLKYAWNQHYGLPNRDEIKEKNNLSYESLLPEDLEILKAIWKKEQEENNRIHKWGISDALSTVFFSAETLSQDIDGAKSAIKSGYKSEIGEEFLYGEAASNNLNVRV